MDTDKIFSKLKELGHIKSKREELQEFCKEYFDTIVKFLPRRILDRDGSDILDCLFNGLSGDNHHSPRFKVKCADIVLQTLRQHSTFLRHCSDVTSRLCLELPQMPPHDLVRWSNESVKSIIDETDANMIWRDIIPECLSALAGHSSIRHSGTDMSPAEYKNRCVNTLCAHTNYHEKQLVQLTAMFTDMQLSRDDHKEVVTLLCSYILNFPPETLPPLVHQLLKLCKFQHIEIVLCHLSRYFVSRLYSRLLPPVAATESEATTVDDIDDISTEHSPAELSRCLSTCIYHITKGSADPELIKKHIRIWPKTELLKSPFIIDVALAMSDKGPDFRTVCLNAIKLSIEQREVDLTTSKEAAWTRAVLPPHVNVADLMKVLTTESANHRELTVVGLINLAFVLLATGGGAKGVGRKGVGRYRGACSLGTLLLVRLTRAQSNTAQHILSRLCDCLADQQQKQYTDCLHALCSLSPASVERCSALTAILEGAQGEGGAKVFQAVQPLIGFSTRTRDALVMVCRKGLYSRDSTHRCLALTGFLAVLRNIKLSRSFSASQCGSEPHSGHSYLTQLTVDVHSSYLGDGQSTSRVKNEAVCMEVVSILRRCLGQDATVKQLLYTKLFECTKDKPALNESILELLQDQLSRQLPALGLFSRAVKLAGHTAVLQEPIGHLIYTVAQFLQIEDEELEDMLSSQVDVGGAHLQSKLMLTLEDLISGEQFLEIDMGEDPGLTDLTPESKAKALMVQQAIQCYEALIAHQIMQWKPNSDQMATKVYKLYKDCANLLEQTKAPPKAAKKANKPTQSQKSQKSQKDKRKAPVKVSNLVKERAGPFKPLPCLWDLHFCHRLIEFLYNERVPWCSLESSNQLRSKRDFHLWSLKCISSAIPATIEKKSCPIVANMAGVLYKRCICRFEDMCRFDEQTTIGCIDLFRECLVTLLSPDHGLKLNKFLPSITGLSEETNEHQIATILDKLHAALATDTEEEQQNDVINKKMTQSLMQTIVVMLEIPVYSDVTHTVLLKIEDYIRSTRNDCVSLLPSVLSAAHRERLDASFLDDLIDKLGSALGFIDEEDSSMPSQESNEFPSIDARTGQGAVVAVCGTIQARAKVVQLMLARAKAVDEAASYRGREDTRLQEMYKATTVQLCLLSRWCGAVGKLRVSVGVGSAAVLTSTTALYGLLAKLARQIKPAMAPRVRFDRLLKLSGKKLSQVIDNLIIYLEGSQQEQDAKKVLRDTKLIPRLVMETEQFRTEVIELGKKAKMDYEQHLSLGTARDFRIRAPAILDALQRERNQNQQDENIDDVSTDLQSPVASENSDNEETSQRKRRRVS